MPGQDEISLVMHPWIGAVSSGISWVGNRMCLLSHWPCITDNSGISAYGFNDLSQGDEHPAYVLRVS